MQEQCNARHVLLGKRVRHMTRFISAASRKETQRWELAVASRAGLHATRVLAKLGTGGSPAKGSTKPLIPRDREDLAQWFACQSVGTRMLNAPLMPWCVWRVC